jgi:hypothetical protein
MFDHRELVAMLGAKPIATLERTTQPPARCHTWEADGRVTACCNGTD